MKLTHNRVKELLLYNDDTGHFFWRSTRKIAGTLRVDGYIQIRVDGVAHYAHRLAWLYVTGEWPKYQIDHMNGIRSDNRASNLRGASHSDNCRNAKPWRRAHDLPKGVHRSKKRFSASITVNRRKIYLGHFKSAAEAHGAYIEAAKKHFQNFARTQ